MSERDDRVEQERLAMWLENRKVEFLQVLYLQQVVQGEVQFNYSHDQEYVGLNPF